MNNKKKYMINKEPNNRKKILNNFYVRMLIRALKEKNAYDTKLIQISYMYDSITRTSNICFPHCLYDKLSFCPDKTINLFFSLIKDKYISLFKYIIKKHGTKNVECINEDELWNNIKELKVKSYLIMRHGINGKLFFENKFKWFYPNLIDENEPTD